MPILKHEKSGQTISVLDKHAAHYRTHGWVEVEPVTDPEETSDEKEADETVAETSDEKGKEADGDGSDAGDDQPVPAKTSKSSAGGNRK